VLQGIIAFLPKNGTLYYITIKILKYNDLSFGLHFDAIIKKARAVKLISWFSLSNLTKKVFE